VLGAVSLLFAPLWIEWVTVILNSSGGLAYSILEIPMMAFPILAWVGRRRAGPLDPMARPSGAGGVADPPT
jgi:hypothetical protein